MARKKLGQRRVSTGRPALYGKPMIPIDISLPEKHKLTLRKIGRGSVSEGVRVLVDAHTAAAKMRDKGDGT